MRDYSDEFILNTYEKAVELHLDPEFLALLEQEMERRNLKIAEYRLT